MNTQQKGLSIAWRIYIPLLVAAVVLIAVVFWLGNRSANLVEERTYKNAASEMGLYYQQLLEEKHSAGLVGAVTIANNDAFVEAMRELDRPLALQASTRIMDEFRENTPFQNIRIHLHTPDVHSFLRAWVPDHHGDDLSGFRHTITEVKRSQKPFSAIEVGRVGLTFRGLAPIMDGPVYLGSVEFMQGYGTVISAMRENLDTSLIATLAPDHAEVVQAAVAQGGGEVPQIHNLTVAQGADSVDQRLLQEANALRSLPAHGHYATTANYLITTQPVEDFSGQVIGEVILGGNLADIRQAADQARQVATGQTITIALIFILVMVVIAIVVELAVKRPLRELSSMAANLSSGEGDLTQRLPIRSNDEIGLACSSINRFLEATHKLIKESKNASSENASVANELSTTANQIGRRAEEESEVVNRTTGEAEEARAQLGQMLEGIEASRSKLIGVNKTLGEASSNMEVLAQNVSESVQTETELAERLNRLSHDADQVKAVLSVIRDIADQTNLLALNAAIEAARAGEHGRGFAVVADEVRKLAERTQRSLTESDATISVITQSIGDLSEAMNQNSQKVQQLTESVDGVNQTIHEASQAMQEGASMAEKSAAESQDTARRISGLIENVGHINELSGSNARSVEEIAAAAEHLFQMTDKLNAQLGRFKI